MTSPGDMHRGPLLRLYLGLSYLFPLIASRLLRKRLARGKEDATRWPEKLGKGLAPRPEGRLIWLHAVGLGEVLSLRGLIAGLAARDADLSFLVTSTTRASAQVFTANLPPRTIHQFLPLDAPTYRKRFLDHFQPDLCVWAEQDLWPGFVSDIAARDIPQALIAARMNERSFQQHDRAQSLYRDLYRAMALLTAQDTGTAAHISALSDSTAEVTGSLKPAAPALQHDAAETDALKALLADRFIWAVAPSHAADETHALAAHTQLRQTHPDALLIIAPRFPERGAAIAGSIDDPVPMRSRAEQPSPQDPIWLCDTFGDLGMIYRLSQAVLIGGTFDDTEGHNPWEAAALHTAILHGPRIGNFTTDYAQLGQAKGAIAVSDADALAQALIGPDLDTTAQNALTATKAAGAQTNQLCSALLRLMDKTHG
ncbi:3-deoxy-D-manno-octulosonic acid transferase [Loktanella agnita]|uniref:3-deoxy-D-manno-octulosonic acid transferase n=1 Tax=Loktanella agnita TaxID=287097 RepID=UPI0039880694